MYGWFAAAALLRIHLLTKYTNIRIVHFDESDQNIYIILDIDFWSHSEARPRGVVAQSKKNAQGKAPTKCKAETLNINRILDIDL